ncbi:MAG: hypothetical protein CM1200mP2_15620 [Planctomycetaceae bacterium]|nr:MAG: hypothetical protein CM1200mP2_15620 [Planctomycetaceae bacterium]
MISQRTSSLPTPKKLAGLEDLEKELDRKPKGGDVDLGTLRWIWDACENVCGGPDSYGIRFRRVTLLTKGVITDAKLPDVWSLRLLYEPGSQWDRDHR